MWSMLDGLFFISGFRGSVSQMRYADMLSDP